jgi:hypothetical protein
MMSESVGLLQYLFAMAISTTALNLPGAEEALS